MKTTFFMFRFTAFCLLFSLFGFAQVKDTSFVDPIGRTWSGKVEKGKKTGVWRIEIKGSGMYTTETYKNDLLNGITENYTAGVLQSSSMLINGKKNGKTFVYSKGKPDTEVDYVNDQIHGKFKRYFDGTAILKSELSYSKDMLDGPVLINHPNGKTWVKGVAKVKFFTADPEVYLENGQQVKPVNNDYTAFENEINKCLEKNYLAGTLAYKKPEPKAEEPVMTQSGGSDMEFDPESVGGAQQAEDPNAIYTYADESPQFPGGDAALLEWLTKNIKYPAAEKKDNIQGTVMVGFVVRKDGSISDIKILKAVKNGPGLSQEAIRLFKSMPAWKPGVMNGKPVHVSTNCPVTFKL